MGRCFVSWYVSFLDFLECMLAIHSLFDWNVQLVDSTGVLAGVGGWGKGWLLG